MRWFGRRDEKDSVKLARLLHLLGDAQMSKVNRIECAAEDAGLHDLLSTYSCLRADLAVAKHDELASGQIFQAHGPERVQFGGRNADFRTESKLVAIGKT